MMTSNLISRFLPTNPLAPSIYQELRDHDEALDLEGGFAQDEENLGVDFNEHDLQDADIFNGEDSRLDSRMNTESTAFLRSPEQRSRRPKSGDGRNAKHGNRSTWLSRSPRLIEEEGDDDVPASLLIEGGDNESVGGNTGAQGHAAEGPTRRTAIPGPSTQETRARWETVQAHQQLHAERGNSGQVPQPARPRLITGGAREKAMWTWINVTNLDGFIHQVYEYYEGSGIWCICLSRLVSMATMIFVTTFITFLTQCVNYSKIPGSQKMDQILVKKCTSNMSGLTNFLIWIFTAYTTWQAIKYVLDIRRLMRMREFYTHLLDIPDIDMQTVTWQTVIAKLMALRDANPITAAPDRLTSRQKHFMGSQSKQRLDAHDIANRLMRKDNYLIALFNKEIIDLNMRLPFVGDVQLFSRTLEWNLQFCVLDFLFNENGQVRQLTLKESHRRQLIAGLRQRFMFAAFMNFLCAPIIVIYMVVTYFFRYFNEYQKDPSALGARQYTPLAGWKFRDFNEVEHMFQERKKMSYPFASRYIDQFPKKKTAECARFVAFVTGAMLSVLAIAAIIDPELFLGFEITKDRTVLFYLGVLGTVWATARGSIPEEDLVFDPEYALRNVIDYTHYEPDHWKDRLHTDEVKREFSVLYKMKIIIFLEEITGIIFTPFMLWFNLSRDSERIVDFFREFTVHVDGLGYICSFAMFDFNAGVGRRGQQNKSSDAEQNNDVRNDYYSTKHGKMAASYHNFMDNYAANPRTGIPGHVPPGQRNQFHPPPSFPGLMSPTLAPDLHKSRLDRGRSNLATGLQAARTPRFNARDHASPMPSILLDAHNQPSSTGFGKRPSHSSRTHAKSRHNVRDEPLDEEVDGGLRRIDTNMEESTAPYGELDESRWETSPTRASLKTDESADKNEGGLLGMLYDFQKAHTGGRGPGVNI